MKKKHLNINSAVLTEMPTFMTTHNYVITSLDIAVRGAHTLVIFE